MDNRELKFRAYYQKVSDDKYVIEGEYSMADLTDRGILFDQERIKWVQYIGVSDANGNEIYEGDIVRVPAGYGGDLWFNSFIGCIEYDPADFYINQRVSIENTRKWSGQDYEWGQLEVIGDIYTTPKLLK